MLSTLRISFSLKNTYRVNSILYSLKQIPLVKLLLPATIYQAKGLKIFANVLSLLWELVTIFLYKWLYFFTMVVGIGLLYEKTAPGAAFLHILLFLTLIGSYLNTGIFNPTRDKYYAMILLRMNAKSYTLVNYGYTLFKFAAGFLLSMLVFGFNRGVPLWLCLLIPFSVAGVKIAVTAYSLGDYEKSGRVPNENKLEKFSWILTGVLLVLAYVPPALGYVLPLPLSAALFLIWIPLGLLSLRRVLSFPHYRALNQELLSQIASQMDAMKKAAKTASEKSISADTSITSQKEGFAYLNELFIKRHRKILWRSTLRIAGVCAALVCGVQLLMMIQPGVKSDINQMVMTWLPYFTFILYLLNRGYRLYQGTLYELRPQPAHLLLFQAAGFRAEALQDPPVGDHEDQRSAGAGHRRRPLPHPLCLRRHQKSPGLRRARGIHSGHERLLLHPLSHRLLSPAALYGRDGDEERYLPHCNDPHLHCLLCHDESPPAHS